MFGDLLGNMQEKQEELRRKLAEITVDAEAGDGRVRVTANAVRQIVNITIDPALLSGDEAEQLEDLLLVAVNRALEAAAEKETSETQRLLKDMLPPGLGDLTGLFG